MDKSGIAEMPYCYPNDGGQQVPRDALPVLAMTPMSLAKDLFQAPAEGASAGACRKEKVGVVTLACYCSCTGML